MNKGMIAIGILLVFLGLVGVVMIAFYSMSGNFAVPVTVPSDRTIYGDTVTKNNAAAYENLMRNLMTDFSKQTYESPGEMIYLTAVNKDGVRLTATFTGAGMPMKGMMSRRIACANCHGADGQGDFLFPDGTTLSADIRWSTLAEEGFDQSSFNLAVTKGEDEKGQALSSWMPRWTMSDSDLQDLAAYLKTL